MFLKLEARLKESLIARDVFKSDVFRLLKSHILAAAKKINLPTAEITDEMVVSSLRSQIKNCQEACQLYEQHHKPQALEDKKRELAILEDLLPPQLSVEELKKIARQVIQEQDLSLKPANYGKLIVAIKDRVDHSADPRDIAQVLRNLEGDEANRV